MKARILTAVAAVILAASCARDSKEFTFVQLSDPQIGFQEKDNPPYPVTTAQFRQSLAEVNVLKPDFVIITGDLLNNPETDTQREQYEECMKWLDPSIQVWAVPGNHDMRPYNDTTRQRFLDWNGYERFSFVHKNCAFIGLDSNCIKEGMEERAEDQWNWLIDELKKAEKCNHRFLFIHCPVVREQMDEEEDYFNFPKELRQKYVDLCNEYKVDAFFSGHTHNGHFVQFGDTQFVNDGPVGPALDGGVSGYNVIKVTPKSWSYEYMTLEEE